jgi:hypothetical protein
MSQEVRDEHKYEVLVPTLEFHGPVAFHNMPCAVCRQQHAVLDLSRGVFQPCWGCRRNWAMVPARNRRRQMIWCLVIVVVGAVMLILNTRAAYRNGVCDGYRAGVYPSDPIHDNNGVKRLLKDQGVWTTPASGSTPGWRKPLDMPLDRSAFADRAFEANDGNISAGGNPQ